MWLNFAETYLKNWQQVECVGETYALAGGLSTKYIPKGNCKIILQ